MSQELYNIFMSKDIFLSLFIAMFTVVYFFFSLRLIRRIKNKKSERKRTFFSSFTNGLHKGTIETYDDLLNLYKGVMDLSSDDLTYKPGLSKLLREYLVQIISGDIDKQADNFTLSKWKGIVTKLISKNDEVSPFADLPDVERNIINDIVTYLETDDKDSIRRKLGELASSVQSRYDDFVKISNINRWSVPLAIIGLILTTIFGIISVFK